MHFIRLTININGESAVNGLRPRLVALQNVMCHLIPRFPLAINWKSRVYRFTLKDYTDTCKQSEWMATIVEVNITP